MVGFYFVVRAWARDGRSWLVQYGFLDDWSQVDRLLDSTWPVEDREDVVMPLWRAAVDIGGHETAQENALSSPCLKSSSLLTTKRKRSFDCLPPTLMLSAT